MQNNNNQKTLHHDIRDYFEGLEQGDIRDLPEDMWITEEEKKHGRVEQREVRSVTDIDWIEGKAAWKDLKTIIQYRSMHNIEQMKKEVAAWNKARNESAKKINWRFSTDDARIKLKRLYPLYE